MSDPPSGSSTPRGRWRDRRGLLLFGSKSPGAGGLEHSCTPGGGQFLAGEVVAFGPVAGPVRCRLVVERIGAAFVERHDVVDDVGGGVEVVGDGVVDWLTADVAVGFSACDGFAMPIPDGGVAACAHSSTSMRTMCRVLMWVTARSVSLSWSSAIVMVGVPCCHASSISATSSAVMS